MLTVVIASTQLGLDLGDWIHQSVDHLGITKGFAGLVAFIQVTSVNIILLNQELWIVVDSMRVVLALYCEATSFYIS